jgi:hypothetical protein
MSNVYVLGSGASFGEYLEVNPERQWDTTYFRRHTHCDVFSAPNPPLVDGFFTTKYLWAAPSIIENGIDGQRSSHAELIAYIRRRWGIDDPFGTGRWENLSVEDVFTELTIENEFSAPGTTAGAVSQILINKLKRYVHSVVAHSTMCRYGRYSKLLAQSIFENDTVINFNYDLLMDQELFGGHRPQYDTFLEVILGQSAHKPGPRGYGCYLKMHGSINWLTCTNPSCRDFSKINIGSRSDWSTYEAGIGNPIHCDYCQGEMTNLLIPPPLNNPMTQIPVFRSIWGHALAALLKASNIIVIGFSFAPTDCYAEWLFRKSVRKDTRVWIVNPLDTAAFKRRMSGIFRFGYDHTYRTYDEIEKLLNII